MVTAFFDRRVAHLNSKSNLGKATSTIFWEQEEEKKRKYQQGVLDVEMESFISIVFFGTNAGMGAECNCFLKRLAEKLSKNNEKPYHFSNIWIRTLLSFEVLRSVYASVRGSRTPFHKFLQGDFMDKCQLLATQARIRLIDLAR